MIGAQVTAVSTLIAGSRVSTHTGRRPAGGPRSAQKIPFALPRRSGLGGQPSGGLDERRIRGLATVGGLQFPIGGGQGLGAEHGVRTASEEFGATRTEACSEGIELGDKVVIELNQNFAACHDHMVSHR